MGSLSSMDYLGIYSCMKFSFSCLGLRSSVSNRSFCANRNTRFFINMLKVLLILCWSAIFVSAGDTNISNGTIVSNQAGTNVAPNSHLPSETAKLPASSNHADVHVPSIASESPVNSPKSSDANKKVNVPTSTEAVVEEIPPVSPNITLPPPNITTPTTTITPAPNTTTSIPPIPPTTPLPPPSTGKWKVEKNHTLCIIVQMAVQFNVSYNNSKNVIIHKAIDIPKDSNSTGICGATEQNITVSWGLQNATKNNFTLHFVKDNTTKYYSLHHLEISLVPEELPGYNKSNTMTFVHLAPQFSTGLSNSYRCLKQQKLNLTIMNTNNTIGYLKVSELQFQAFRSDNTTVFGLAKDCAFDTPDIVPITVGCALAGLVVIVLIAYLVGRRRSQARGYLSM